MSRVYLATWIRSPNITLSGGGDTHRLSVLNSRRLSVRPSVVCASPSLWAFGCWLAVPSKNNPNVHTSKQKFEGGHQVSAKPERTESVRPPCCGLVFKKVSRTLLALATNSCLIVVKSLCGAARCG